MSDGSAKKSSGKATSVEGFLAEIETELDRLKRDSILNDKLLEKVQERVAALRVYSDDLREIEAKLDSVRRAVIEPVARELDRGTKWAKWGTALGVVGAVVGIVAVIPLMLPAPESLAVMRVRQFAASKEIHVVGANRGFISDRPSHPSGAESDHKWGAALVEVTDTSGPVLLVLSAWEKVQWTVKCSPGVQLTGILVGGDDPQEVVECPSGTTVVYLTREIAGPEEYFVCEAPEYSSPGTGYYRDDEKLASYRRLLRALQRTAGSQAITTFTMEDEIRRVVVPPPERFAGPRIVEPNPASSGFPKWLIEKGSDKDKAEGGMKD